jgi:membrane protease subunit HflK
MYLKGISMSESKPSALKNDPWGRPNRNNQPPELDKILKDFFKKHGGKTPKNANLPIIIALIAAIIIWALSGIFVVSEGHTAVVLRFGEFNRELGRGLKWYAPILEQKYIVSTERISTYEYEAEMLTTDENYARVKVALLYRIQSPSDYLFNVKDPIDTLKEVTASALRQVVGQSTLEEVLSSGKEQVRQEIEDTVVSTLDSYDMGIQVRGVKLLAALPPMQVSEAFEDAIKAREDEQRFINIAEAYYNEILPKAKGKASRILNEAEAIKESTILRAKAEIEGFNALIPIYKKDPELLTTRLYIQTMEEILSKTPKVIINGDKNISYLPLADLMNNSKRSQ